MTYGKITNKQREVLEYLKQQVLQKGYPPSVREICDAVGLKSTSSVHGHLESLERNGYIRKDPTKPRAIEIVDDGFNLVRTETVYIPEVGKVAAGQPILVDDSANVKTFYKEDGHYRLQPQNSSMEPIIVDNVEIIGKVISLFRPKIVS